jgi:hypothetical protein
MVHQDLVKWIGVRCHSVIQCYAFVSAFVCSFRGLFACVLSWVEICYTVLRGAV